MKNVKFASVLIGTLLGIAAGTVAYIPEAPATEQAQQRRAENNKSNAECRQDKRDTKQEGRQEKREIKY